MPPLTPTRRSIIRSCGYGKTECAFSHPCMLHAFILPFTACLIDKHLRRINIHIFACPPLQPYNSSSHVSILHTILFPDEETEPPSSPAQLRPETLLVSEGLPAAQGSRLPAGPPRPAAHGAGDTRGLPATTRKHP